MACSDGRDGSPIVPSPPPVQPPAPPPPEPPSQGAASSWSVSFSKGSAAGAPCVLSDEGATWRWYDETGSLLVKIDRGDGAIALSHSGPFEDLVYEGEMAGRDFRASLDWTGDVGSLLRCSDGTGFGTVVCGDEIAGQFSEDDRSFTATKRNMCRQVSTGANVLTRSWTWSGRKN